jgi:trigger factor
LQFLKIDVSAINGWKRSIAVRVETEEMARPQEQAISRFQKRIHLDGFRKGKVPMTLIRQRFQKVMDEDVAEELAEVFYKKAVQEQNLDPVAPGVLKDVHYKENETLEFKAEVEVEPEVSVRDYKGLKAERESWKIEDVHVQQVIDDLRERHAEMKPSGSPARIGDMITGDIQALDTTGVPIIGQKWEKRWIELGRPPLGDVVQTQLDGVTVDEERPFTVMEKGTDEKGRTRDQERRYAIRVKTIHQKLLPDLNDDFAKKAGNFETLDVMRDGIRKYLEADRDAYSRRQMTQRIADEIIRRNDFELPPSLVEFAFSRFMEQFAKEHAEVPEAEARKQNLPLIEWNLKWRRIWAAIARAEGMAVTDEDVENEIQKAVQARPQDEKRIRARFKDASRLESLKDTLLEDKVMSMLVEHSKIKEVTLAKPAHIQMPAES